jgi:hypothetical protein
MNLTVFRRWLLCPLVLAILLYQGYESISWMRWQALRLAPAQEIRARAGDWLEQHADRSRPVLSGDLGAIAYHAPNVRFIDTTGLISPVVLEAYKYGENLDAIVRMEHPGYIADTFGVKDRRLVYTHGDGSLFKNGKPSHIPMVRAVFAEQFWTNAAIAIVELP